MSWLTTDQGVLNFPLLALDVLKQMFFSRAFGELFLLCGTDLCIKRMQLFRHTIELLVVIAWFVEAGCWVPQAIAIQALLFIYLFIYYLVAWLEIRFSSRSNCSKNRAREQEPARCSCLGTRPRVLDAQRCSSKVSVGGMTWHRRSPGHDAIASAQQQTEHSLQASSLKAPHHRSRRLLDSNPVDSWCCIATF